LVWAAEVAGCSPQDILDFSASINPLGVPTRALAAIQAHLQDLIAYPDPSYGRLRQVLAQHHGVAAEWVLPGNGAAELLTWAARDLAALPAVVLWTPSFSDYGRALAAFGAKIVPVPLDSAQPPLAGLGLLWNNPHNPTGRLFERDDLLRAVETAALMVVDEAFMDFVPAPQNQSLIDWVERYPQLVVLRSLTKFYALPGLRLGYAIAHPERLQRWQQWRDPWPVNALAAAAGEVLLSDRDYQVRTMRWLAKAKPQLEQGLQQLPGLVVHPSAANFFLVSCNCSATDLQRQLLQHHRILIRDCLSFPELGDRAFRVAVRSSQENQRLLDGLADILTAQLHWA
jgi:L-threonine-O-3-phosphate decarboxylase